MLDGVPLVSRDGLSPPFRASRDDGVLGVLPAVCVTTLLERTTLARPYHGYHHWIYHKATTLVHGIITSHGFVDGNKRTALYLVLKLVDKCRDPHYILIADNEEIVSMFVSVANGRSRYEGTSLLVSPIPGNALMAGQSDGEGILSLEHPCLTSTGECQGIP